MDDRLDATVATDPTESGVYVAQDTANCLYRLNAETGTVEWGLVPFAPKGCTTGMGVIRAYRPVEAPEEKSFDCPRSGCHDGTL